MRDYRFSRLLTHSKVIFHCQQLSTVIVNAVHFKSKGYCKSLVVTRTVSNGLANIYYYWSLEFWTLYCLYCLLVSTARACWEPHAYKQRLSHPPYLLPHNDSVSWVHLGELLKTHFEIHMIRRTCITPREWDAPASLAGYAETVGEKVSLSQWLLRCLNGRDIMTSLSLGMEKGGSYRLLCVPRCTWRLDMRAGLCQHTGVFDRWVTSLHPSPPLPLEKKAGTSPSSLPSSSRLPPPPPGSPHPSPGAAREWMRK